MRAWLLAITVAGAVQPSAAQPKIGLIDFYGERKTSTERILKAAGVKPGDPLPPSKLDVEEKIETLPNVVRAHVEAACCTADGGAVLYLGVEERGAPHFPFRVAAEYSEEARADAPALLGDAPATQETVEALQLAAQDPDPVVRSAAVRGLVRASGTPGLQVLPTWIVEMLNSVVYSDRQTAVEALLKLTESGDAVLIGKIRETGFDSLVQMARWKHLPHALPPYLLLCRISGISEAEAQSAWSVGEREKLIARIVKGAKRR